MQKKDINEVLKEANSSGITAQRSFGAQNRPRGRKPKNEDEKAKNYMLKVRDGKCIQAKIKTNAQKILNDIS